MQFGKQSGAHSIQGHKMEANIKILSVFIGGKFSAVFLRNNKSATVKQPGVVQQIESSMNCTVAGLSGKSNDFQP